MNGSIDSIHNSVITQQLNDEKRKYGALLPKSGVYFLPDEKVVGFLKLLNHNRQEREKEGDYATAKQMKTKFEEFSKAEQQRQE